MTELSKDLRYHYEDEKEIYKIINSIKDNTTGWTDNDFTTDEVFNYDDASDSIEGYYGFKYTFEPKKLLPVTEAIKEALHEVKGDINERPSGVELHIYSSDQHDSIVTKKLGRDVKLFQIGVVLEANVGDYERMSTEFADLNDVEIQEQKDPMTLFEEERDEYKSRRHY